MPRDPERPDLESSVAQKQRAYVDALVQQELDMRAWGAAVRKCAAELARLALPLGCPVEGFDRAEVVALLCCDLAPTEDWRARAAVYAQEYGEWYDPGSDGWFVDA